MGGVHGDMIRGIPGTSTTGLFSATNTQSGALTMSGVVTRYNISQIGDGSGGESMRAVGLEIGRVVPTGNVNKPRAWGALACAYLGQPAS